MNARASGGPSRRPRHGREEPRDVHRGLDRVRPPDPRRPQPEDVEGRRALYTVDADAHPTPFVIVACPRCEVERGLALAEATRLLRPPVVWNPLFRKVWTRCPTCDERTWLRVARGPGIPWPFRPSSGA